MKRDDIPDLYTPYFDVHTEEAYTQRSILEKVRQIWYNFRGDVRCWWEGVLLNRAIKRYIKRKDK